MFWLILAIISSALVSIMLRLGEGRIRSSAAMFVTNYTVCLILSRYFMGGIELFTGSPGISTALWLGALSGVLYLLTFILLQQNIRKNGVVMASVFMKLGVLVPVCMAILVFRERPELRQILGIFLAVAAILVVQLEGGVGGAGAVKHRFLLILLLFGGGFTDSTANIYDKLGTGALRDHYLFYTFLAAHLSAGVLLLWEMRKEQKKTGDLGGASFLFGILVGVPNYFSARFLLLALGSIPAMITYPLYSVVTMLVIGMTGVLCFGEKLSRGKILAILMVAVALSLLN